MSERSVTRSVTRSDMVLNAPASCPTSSLPLKWISCLVSPPAMPTAAAASCWSGLLIRRDTSSAAMVAAASATTRAAKATVRISAAAALTALRSIRTWTRPDR